MRVSATRDRLEIEFALATGASLAIAGLTALAPLILAFYLVREGDPLGAIAPAAFGGVIVAIVVLGRRLTTSRCVLDRARNEVRIDRHDLAPMDTPALRRMAMHAAIGPLDAVEGAEVLEDVSEGSTFYKPALRVRGRKPLALTSYGAGSRAEADAAVRAIEEWLGKAAPTSAA